MRLTVINSTRRWGGVKSWTLRVASALQARGHEVQLVLRRGTDHTPLFREAGLPVEEVAFGPDYNPAGIRAVRRILMAQGAEVALTNVSRDNRVGGVAARSLGIPVLQRVGGPGDITDRFPVRFEQRHLVDHIVTPAYAIRDSLARFPWMRADERVTVVHNGVDLERFRPGPGRGLLRRALELNPGVPLLVTTGQLTAIKDHRGLLQALAGLEVPGPAPVLALVGQGAEEENLRTLARELGLADRVRFLGFRRDLDALLEDADVAIQPSGPRGEGFPNSVVEFMAKGLCVVATAVAGVPEAVQDGVSGLLVPPSDPDALREALRRTLSDPGLRESLGSGARSRAVSEFGETLMVDRMEALLGGMLPSQPARFTR